jgi:hypothetical protein
MAADPLEQVLRLVAEGRLTADEAAPILAALDADPGSGAGPAAAAGAASSGGRPEERNTPSSGATNLRIEVWDGRRPVMNLRLPIAVGRFALDNVPGLSGDQLARVREALAAGRVGPIFEVDDGDDRVRIILE